MSVKTYRKENIEALSNVILRDEYDDEAQRDVEYDSDVFIEFVRRNIVGPDVLEIGPGCGMGFEYYPITHAVEPSPFRCDKAKERVKLTSVEVKQGFAEAIPYENDMFNSVLFIRGFFQVRSDYETIIEINRVLKIGGCFIFDLTRDAEDFVCGRAYGPGSYVRILNDFGFSVVEVRDISETRVGICVRKRRNFDYRYLNKIQLVKIKDVSVDGYIIKNFLPERDALLL